MSMATQQGIGFEVRVIDRTELLVADELFVCGSAAEVRAIGSVDRLLVGAGGFGSVTSTLLKTYHAAVDGQHPIRTCAACAGVWGLLVSQIPP